MALRGLSVNAQYQLTRDGVRFRNIGLNYPGAIVRIYSQPSALACAYTPSAEQDAMLDFAQSIGVRVLRVKATPYWPAQLTYGVNGGIAGVSSSAANREAHYLAIDAFLAKCSARNISVILNLFFRIMSVPDLAGQTGRSGWLSGGATRTYAQALTTDIVTRYLTNETVSGYEFSNEVNHYNDASDATRGTFPGANTGYGTPAGYSAANDLFVGADYAGVLSWWYGVVKAIDPNRIVMTGNGPNSYSLPSGTAGISTPMSAWHQEQVRDNPTNCGSAHWYGNVGYSSANFRGLNAVLTGMRHWQKSAGRAFVLGEFGNQPWTMTNISAFGGVATFTVASSCPVEVGDPFIVGGTTTFDGQYTVATVNAARTSLSANCSVSGSWTGSVKGLHYMSGQRVARMCDDIIKSDCDVALFWMLDGDPGAPMFESINHAANTEQAVAIKAANASLGW